TYDKVILMKYFTTITAKGQITLPADIRYHWKVRPGQKVMVELGPNGQAIVQPLVDITDVRQRTKRYLAEQGLNATDLHHIAQSYQSGQGLETHLKENLP